MSSFQTSLVIIGAIVLIAVVAYNAWNTRRHAPRRARAPVGAGHAAPEPGRREPLLDAGAPALAPDGEEAAHDWQELQIDPAPLPGLEGAPAAQRGALDALVDVIVPITAEQQVSGDAALAALPHTRRVGSKPFAVEGLNETTQQWEKPRPGQRYRQFQAGVQLANRLGALNEIEFSEFVAKSQAFADAINAAPEFPDMLHEVARARELDQFASSHDAQLTFTLRARQAAWSPGYIQQSAAPLGFVIGTMPGRLVLPAAQPGSPPLLTLGYDAQAAMSDEPERSALREISLALDVPQVPRQEQPFARLREVAAQLCRNMDGVLCDPEGQPLPVMAMEPIAADLEQLYDQLDERELSAGSLLARRVFS
ncbi:cell division protein ZipA C-terminal FtsZ-binding domain-containing protein [Comamonas flocculans]|uniref:Cell division protein FtsZ n=1 Tax=Comamonas flocculans TaxID=2597701 RepID=A0A5B8RYE0_9BURK|nr:cell division protein ZipA C-terminal FtsZ-binding domain-containing protein [Comamonas flocculans]QEA14153.1 cell division protein FtsZ [Comamonas flocculans]